MTKEEILAVLTDDSEPEVREIPYKDEEIINYLKAVSFTGKDGIASMSVMGMASSFGPSDCCPQNTCAGNSSCSFM